MSWLSVVLTLVCFGAAGALVGRFKDRLMAGVVWGVLFGPIGWLIVLLGPAGRTPCPYCGASITLRQARCGACGAKMTWIRGKPLGPRRTEA